MTEHPEMGTTDALVLGQSIAILSKSDALPNENVPRYRPAAALRSYAPLG